MRLLSFKSGESDAVGALIDGGVVNLTARLGPNFASLREIIATDSLDTVRAEAGSADPDLSIDDIRFLPTVPDPEK